MSLAPMDPPPLSTNFALAAQLGKQAHLKGRTEPRLFTPPLVELTPETSYGFDVIEFARRVMRRPLLPWQEWAAIHLGELLPDGRPRFRIFLLLVARQNGKTDLLVTLALYWLYIDKVKLVVGTSTNLVYAQEPWLKVSEFAEDDPLLSQEFLKRRDANGEQQLELTGRRRYKIGAANRRGGRSLTIERLIVDELREQLTWDAWNAAEPAASPEDAQIVALSNAGDDRSIVLNSLQTGALEGLDPRLGIAEWSAADGSDPEDIDAILQANPRVGYGLDIDAILGHAARAKAAGGKELTGFLTEKMCMRVRALDAAIDPGHWIKSAVPGVSIADSKRIALFVDVAPDAQHASLLAAVTEDGITTLRLVAWWSGLDSISRLIADLPAWLTKVKPWVIGWFPSGPAAPLLASLGKDRQRGLLPAGVRVQEIQGETAAVCMAFAAEVAGDRIRHPDDPLLNNQALEAERLRTGDRWVFSRRGEGHVDAVYAMAGAVHLARIMPPTRSTRSVVSSEVAAERAKLAGSH